jgi:two-component SAPR family response regulator
VIDHSTSLAETGDAPDPGPWPGPPPDEAGEPRRLLVRVLGEPVVLVPHPDGSYSSVHIRRSAGQQILVLLAVHRDGLSGADLKEALWPDVAGHAAHRSFLTTVSELRRTLRAAARQPVLLQRQQTGTIDGAWYRLDPDAVQVDVWRLQVLLDAADATTDPIHRHEILNAAAGLYLRERSGELAQGWDHEWLAPAREHVARHQIDLHVHLADLEPDHVTAIHLLRRALRGSPTNAAVHARLLHRHAAISDIDGLRRAVATLTEHLAADQLAADPETMRVIDALLANTSGTHAAWSIHVEGT